MATRGEVAYIKEGGSILSCYNHYDSYIDGLGKDLLKDWNTEELAKKAVNTVFGNFSEEDDEDRYEYSSLEAFENWLKESDREFAYLWKDNAWYVLEISWKTVNRNWKLLSDCINE